MESRPGRFIADHPTMASMRPTLYTVQRQGPGRLSTMAKPRGGDWLDDQLHTLRRLDVVVCALPSAELEAVGLTGEAAAAAHAGLEFVWIPIADRGVPALRGVLAVLRALTERLRRASTWSPTAGWVSAAPRCRRQPCCGQCLTPTSVDDNQQRQWVARLPATSSGIEGSALHT